MKGLTTVTFTYSFSCWLFVLRTDPNLPPVNRKDRSDGYLEAHFAVSRDGRNYTRISREAFVPRGIGHPRVGYPGVFEGEFDAASTTVATGSYDVGDETVMVESGWQVSSTQLVDFSWPSVLEAGI